MVFQTTDPDEAACRLAASAVPYRSELLSPASTFSTRIESMGAARVLLSRVTTTGSMHVRALLPAESYAVVIGLVGQLEHRIRGKLLSVGPDRALCQSPLQDVEAQTPERFEVLFARVGGAHLTSELEKRLLTTIGVPLRFSPGFDLRTEAGKMFRRLVFTLCNQRMCDAAALSLPDDRLAILNLEDQLVSLLLEGQRHNYTRLLSQHQDAGPWHVRAAEEYMSANAGQPVSLGDVCAAAGVNSRTLQHSFQRKRGCTPMQFLRALRLDRVRAELSQPIPATTVTDAASRWSFFHFGRFAQQYQARFGEKPSETLLRSRS